jgi:cytochrome oxidase Cu insertion factor (SCO1/SenC/PrrC family)
VAGATTPEGRGKEGQRGTAILWGLAGLVVAGISLLVVVVNQPSRIAQQQASPSAPKEGDKAPGFTLEAADGTNVSLSDFRKKGVLLYFSMGPG